MTYEKSVYFIMINLTHRVNPTHRIFVSWLFMSNIWDSAIPNESNWWLLIKNSHINNVKFVTMKVNWMCDLIIDIHQNKFHNRVELQFYDVKTPVSSINSKLFLDRIWLFLFSPARC